jgi:hypothetical protein
MLWCFMPWDLARAWDVGRGHSANGNSNVLAICGCLFGLAWGNFVTLPTKTFSIFSVHSYVLFYFLME